jgi:hypothetical protein
MTRGLTIDEAAAELRKTSRWLKEWLGKHPVDAAGVPFYVPLGRTKTFEAADIARIRAAIETGENLPDDKKESVVYFVAVRGFIKIGWTTNWRRRFTELQISNPEPIDILLIIGRPKVYEKTMHAKFAEFRANGEWFKDGFPIRSHIATLVDECWYRAGRFR